MVGKGVSAKSALRLSSIPLVPPVSVGDVFEAEVLSTLQLAAKKTNLNSILKLKLYEKIIARTTILSNTALLPPIDPKTKRSAQITSNK